MNAPADGAANLNSLAETATVTPFDSTNTNINTFTRTGSSAVAGSGNVSLLTENALSVKWTVTWSGIPKGKTHRREIVAVLGKGGIAK
jgi:hypothetical protein